MGQCWPFMWLLGPGRSSKGRSPGSEISSPGNNGCWKLDLGHPVYLSRQHPFADTAQQVKNLPAEATAEAEGLTPRQSSMFPVSLRMPLEMAPFGGWGALAAFLSLLCCRGSGEKAFEGPEQLMVGSGEFQFINCTASCKDPKRLVLETALNKTLLENQTQWRLFKVYNISKDEELLCSSTCGGKQETKVFHITVFYPPKQVLLTLSPTSVAVGTLFTIECRVPAVAPLECLIVTLLRGTEILYNQTFVGTAVSPQDAVVTHNTTAHREDGLYNFSCKAQMDMRSRGGGLVHRVSDPQRLEVKGPVPNNQLVIIAIVIVLLLLFVTSVLLCFVFSQKWFRGRTGHYRVYATWRRLIGSHRAPPL